MKRLLEWTCLAVVAAAPVLSIGSLIWFAFLSRYGVLGGLLLGSLGFVGFGFLGMFARGWAHQLRDERHR